MNRAWDEIVEHGWGPAYAAGALLKNVRNHQETNDPLDLKKAVWHFQKIEEAACKDHPEGAWNTVLKTLRDEILTQEEKDSMMKFESELPPPAEPEVPNVEETQNGAGDQPPEEKAPE